MGQVRRRQFLIAAGALLGAPLAAEAQPTGKVYRVGVLWHAESAAAEAPVMRALSTGLRERGYTEGRNLALEHRFPAEVPERFRAMAAELVALKPDVLVGVTGPSALALKSATGTIPIVFTAVGDAVGLGLVDNLGRPGGNVTGFTFMSAGLLGKRLQLLVEILPNAKRIGFLYQPELPLSIVSVGEIEAAAQVLGVTLRLVALESSSDSVDSAFAILARESVKGVVVLGPRAWNWREQIAGLALLNRIAAVHYVREGAESGSLFSYGVNVLEVVRQTGGYIAKILEGATPGQLPVVGPTKFELVINMKTAKALGIAIPRSIVLRADRVIE